MMAPVNFITTVHEVQLVLFAMEQIAATNFSSVFCSSAKAWA